MLAGSRSPYPRVHTRGPIEAGALPAARSDRPRAIRGFTPAAPLKRIDWTRGIGFWANYPRVHTRGPIEAAWSLANVRRLETPIRGFTPAAPLKRPSCFHVRPPLRDLSAGSHPRPH